MMKHVEYMMLAVSRLIYLCFSYDLSCEIEPVTPTTPQVVKGHRKKSSLGFFTPRRPVSISDDLSLSSYSDDTSDTYSAPVTPDTNSLKPPVSKY